MALTCTFTTFTTLISLCMFCVNAATYKQFLQMGQSMGTDDTVISYGGNFELGFFTRTRENSTKYYVGIWSRKVPKDKIVWVANRDYALESTSAVLTIQPDGNMVIIDGQVTYQVNKASNNFSSHATLLDSGNMVLMNTSNQEILWQSFDNPTDTLLPGMNLGRDLLLNYTWSLISWARPDDPAPGAFTLEYDSSSNRASLTVSNGSDVFWIDDNYNNTIANVISRSGVVKQVGYYTWPVGNDSRLVLEVSGEVNQDNWSEKEKRWVSVQSSKCGTDNSCGDFSICDPQARPTCACLHGFESSEADSSSKGDTSAGCVRKTPLSCSNDGFLQFNEVQLPQPSNEYRKPNIGTARACKSICLTNCSCVAYAYEFSGTCWLWLGSVSSLKNISTNVYSSDNTNPVFNLRVAASELISAGLGSMDKQFGHGPNGSFTG
ncbi:hypothetical protein Fmac_021197 [Flemingia macrophylla]|uniref:Uncharacterized protein n=1 Tax=Flemingia macrophylla TaxID=520843 RepID=A0ABD1LXW0_9FABA